jgi:hypothetical protein
MWATGDASTIPNTEPVANPRLRPIPARTHATDDDSGGAGEEATATTGSPQTGASVRGKRKAPSGLAFWDLGLAPRNSG